MVWFLIPVYNEEQNIPLLHQSIVNADTAGEEKHFVFIDDGSSDHSPEVIKKLFQNKCMVLGDGSNHGPGYAFNLGFEYILKHGKPGDRIITLEGDNTSDLTIIQQMLQLTATHDLVLASVYIKGGGFERTYLLKKVLSAIANFTIRRVFRLKIKTLTSFYRVYQYFLIETIRKKYGTIIKEKGFLCMVEILLKASRCNAKIVEVPVMLYSSRRKGKSKMKMMKTAVEYLKFLFNHSDLINTGKH